METKDQINKKSSKNFGELIKTFESSTKEPEKKPKVEKVDLKSQILRRFPKLSEEEFKVFVALKENTENIVRQTVKNKGQTGYLKSLVSKAKSRFVYDGFDLDLTYITPRIIAMGFPSTAIEGLYRNNMEDVKRFFTTRHKNCYKVYNLCGERTYPKDTFYKQSYYPFPDHEAPPLNLLLPFCQDAKAFLEENEKNIVAVHCKAGKGRTGTFICCLMIYLSIFKTADEALAYYGYKDILPVYYEKSLVGKNARDSESAGMLDLIFDNIYFDPSTIYSFLFGDQKSPAMLLRMTIRDDKEIASAYAADKKLYETKIDEINSSLHGD